jgi:hypothetical protein
MTVEVYYLRMFTVHVEKERDSDRSKSKVSEGENVGYEQDEKVNTD